LNPEHRNMLFAIALCLAFYLAYTGYLSSKYEAPEPQRAAAPTTTTLNDPGEPSELRPGGETPAVTQPRETEGTREPQHFEVTEKLSPGELTFETEKAIFRFNQELGAIVSVELKEYREDNVTDQYKQLLDNPLAIQGTPDIARSSPLTGFNAKRHANELTLSTLDGQWLIEKVFTFEPTGYGVDLEIKFTNQGPRSAELTAGLLMQENIFPTQKPPGLFAFFTFERKSLIKGIRGSRNAEDLDKYCDSRSMDAAMSGLNESIDYIGFDDHYFIKVAQPHDDRMSYMVRKLANMGEGGCPIQIITYQPQGRIEAGQQIVQKHRLFFGPKVASVLTDFDPRFRSALYLGWIGFVAYPLLLAVQSLYGIFGNYGIAIIVITIILKLLFYPLTKASTVSMKKMQKLQPKIQAMREKYKDDAKRQQQELMKFMSTHKINPAKGCLPILAQIPVFIAFYQVLSFAIELRHAPFFGWINDLSVADPYFITPVLLGVGMYVQQKLMPNAGMDPAVQRVMMILPVAFTFMMLSLPAGMVIYMLANTVMTILQQQWLNKKLA